MAKMRKEIFYVSAYILIYGIAVSVLVIAFNIPLESILTVFFSFGLCFSSVAWMLTKNINETPSKPSFKNECWLLVILVCWLLLYTTFGSTLIDSWLPSAILQNEKLYTSIILTRKLIVFVVIPFILYKSFGFSFKYFGLSIPSNEIFSGRNIFIFVVMSMIVTLFQFFFSNGGQNFKDENFSPLQMLSGFPLLFIWLFIEVGLVEEFFFRAILQSRISALLRSDVIGILVSGLIFGLAHAPGLYLRGIGKTEGITESMPLGFWISYTICNMSLAGIFLGVIWYKTKNLYLVMAIHAVVDLIPNFSDFVHTWGL